MKLSWDKSDIEEEFRGITCYLCAMKFLVPVVWQGTKRRDHTTFYCPNGHPQSYQGESPEEKLRRERDRLKQENARLEEESKVAWATANEQRADAKAAKATATKLKKRASAGTCPCCKRTFSALAQHMKQKHPTFIAEAVHAD